MSTYRAIIQNRTTGARVIVLPRSKKTGLFASLPQAERALDLQGRRMGAGADAWQGRVYLGDAPHDAAPLLTVAI